MNAAADLAENKLAKSLLVLATVLVGEGTHELVGVQPATDANVVAPVLGSQLGTMQEFVFPLAVSGAITAQVPPMQRSTPLQGWPSLQDVPSGRVAYDI